MKPSRLSLIVAFSSEGIIGADGQLPWRLRADLRRFRKITMGHHVIMGRRTYESLPSSLPGRKLIVLTRQPGYAVAGGAAVSSFEQALEAASNDDRPFVIGGESVFAESLPQVDELFVTVVHDAMEGQRIEGDTRFPEVDWSQWRLEEDIWHRSDADNEYPYSFRRYRRVR